MKGGPFICSHPVYNIYFHFYVQCMCKYLATQQIQGIHSFPAPIIPITQAGMSNADSQAKTASVIFETQFKQKCFSGKKCIKIIFQISILQIG